MSLTRSQTKLVREAESEYESWWTELVTKLTELKQKGYTIDEANYYISILPPLTTESDVSEHRVDLSSFAAYKRSPANAIPFEVNFKTIDQLFDQTDPKSHLLGIIRELMSIGLKVCIAKRFYLPSQLHRLKRVHELIVNELKQAEMLMKLTVFFGDENDPTSLSSIQSFVEVSRNSETSEHANERRLIEAMCDWCGHLGPIVPRPDASR